MKFPLGTRFTFGWLTFAAREDGDLKMLPLGPELEHPTPAPSASGGACSGLNPFPGLYIRTAKLVRGIPIMTSTLRPFIGASSSSSSASSTGRGSSDDYPKIGASSCRNFADDGRLILMVAQTGIGPATALVDIPLLEDQRRLMPRLLAQGWFRI
jgi:hypothetical protein